MALTGAQPDLRSTRVLPLISVRSLYSMTVPLTVTQSPTLTLAAAHFEYTKTPSEASVAFFGVPPVPGVWM